MLSVVILSVVLLSVVAPTASTFHICLVLLLLSILLNFLQNKLVRLTLLDIFITGYGRNPGGVNKVLLTVECVFHKH
jgi:hypothetical protein